MIGLNFYCIVSALIPTISLALILFCNKTKYKKLFIALGIVGFTVFAFDVVGMFCLSEFSVEGLEGEPNEIHLLLPINDAYLLDDGDYYVGYARIDDNVVKELRMKKEFDIWAVDECSLYKIEDDCVSHVDTYYVTAKRNVFWIDVGEIVKVNYIYLSKPLNAIMR